MEVKLGDYTNKEGKKKLFVGTMIILFLLGTFPIESSLLLPMLLISLFTINFNRNKNG